MTKNQNSDQLQSSHNSRRSEALRNLLERVPGLRVLNYIDIIDDNENREPEIPSSRNAQIDAPMTLKE
ncbi:14110_t:CDS:2, partial [Funneliformis caledonium]